MRQLRHHDVHPVIAKLPGITCIPCDVESPPFIYYVFVHMEFQVSQADPGSLVASKTNIFRFAGYSMTPISTGRSRLLGYLLPLLDKMKTERRRTWEFEANIDVETKRADKNKTLQSRTSKKQW